MASHTDEWLTIAEACTLLRVTRATLYRWAKQGRIRLFRLGERATRVRREDLESLISQNDGTSVTIVGPLRHMVVSLGPGLSTVDDAVSRFDPEVHDGMAVYVNQEPCDDFQKRLNPGDLVVVLPGTTADRAKGPEASESEKIGRLRLAESSFSGDWDNEADALYDSWKELYGVSER